jgi:hypothetical protein
MILVLPSEAAGCFRDYSPKILARSLAWDVRKARMGELNLHLFSTLNLMSGSRNARAIMDSFLVMELVLLIHQW